MFHSKVRNLHLQTHTSISGVSIYKFGKTWDVWNYQSTQGIMTNFPYKFQSNLLVSPDFENQTTGPKQPVSTQYAVHHAEIL